MYTVHDNSVSPLSGADPAHQRDTDFHRGLSTLGDGGFWNNKPIGWNILQEVFERGYIKTESMSPTMEPPSGYTYLRLSI